MFGWFRQRREFRQQAEVKATHLIEALGKDDAWETVYRDSRDMTIPEDKRLFNLAVRRAMERKLGIPLHKDTATRYLQSQKR